MKRYVVAAGLVVAVAAVSCGGGGSNDEVLRAKAAIEKLPYHYRYRVVRPVEDSTGINNGTGWLAARATSGDGARLDFTIGVGNTGRIPLPPHATDQGPFTDSPMIYYDDAGFRLPRDTKHTYRERSRMTVRITDALCKEFTGKSCPP